MRGCVDFNDNKEVERRDHLPLHRGKAKQVRDSNGCSLQVERDGQRDIESRLLCATMRDRLLTNAGGREEERHGRGRRVEEIETVSKILFLFPN